MKALSNGKHETARGTVLVTGGAGYIGSLLVRRLLADGYRVRVLDCLLFGDRSLRGLSGHPHFELQRGDIRQHDLLRQSLTGAETVVHLAAIVGDPACNVMPRRAWQTNYEATAPIVEACQLAGVSKLLFASTCSVYGATAELVDEASALNPLSLYAYTKAASEEIVIASTAENFHPTVLRLGTAFGWSFRPRFDLVVNALAAQSLFEKQIEIRNGTQWRPFVHVSDIARALHLAITSAPWIVSGQVFNVGSARMNHRLDELGRAVHEVNPDTLIRRCFSGDARNYRVHFERIRRALSFDCRVELEQGIVEIQNHLALDPALDHRAPIFHNYCRSVAEEETSLSLQAPLPQELERVLQKPTGSAATVSATGD